MSTEIWVTLGFCAQYSSQSLTRYAQSVERERWFEPSACLGWTR